MALLPVSPTASDGAATTALFSSAKNLSLRERNLLLPGLYFASF